MSDDGFSASQLRQRYHKGGSLDDSQLSASQLRARHGIPSNSAEFSTGRGGDSNVAIIASVAIVALVGLLVFLFSK
eukprot:CAMPEP_0196780692 /NCGR_PEP_ID=MMETSP1104-20130614/8441_1 /TAXON_ID=33652 /ORGANISM="Cafeteria sp., Strain Caron Lab Isolate" /LENGTH=75 /DNA_ID=CAMNT_0042150907 /DNA_START=15 /DNA_END=242 /DNA_ORIENTATION=+